MKITKNKNGKPKTNDKIRELLHLGLLLCLLVALESLDPAPPALDVDMAKEPIQFNQKLNLFGKPPIPRREFRPKKNKSTNED